MNTYVVRLEMNKLITLRTKKNAQVQKLSLLTKR